MYKVLHATMGLGIGGAETHIVELVLEMKRRGIDVSVASNGGVYVETLTNAGIRHFTVPMHRRHLPSMLKSYFLMRRIIKAERPDVVHAHARICGFICGLVHKSFRFAFVTTAHFDFKVGRWLRFLSNWGGKTLAVSEDIKKYLTDSYGVDPDDVFVTVNGVNTETFSPDVSPAAVIDEFGLDPSRPVICNVSRMDQNAALASRLLIDIAPELHRFLPGVQLLIAGTGNIYDELLAKASAVNEATGTNTVTMTGMRTDINAILAAGNLFVGVSRAALEALATSRPVILTGNEGFLGLFTPDKEKAAIETNFTCRGCEHPDRDSLLGEILRFFNDLTDDEKLIMGSCGREFVTANYSVSRMTDICISAYDAAMRRKYNIVMSGYYGFKNAGDEAILQSVYRNIGECREDISVTVLSSDPEDTKSRYGYNAVARFNVFCVLGALSRCDMLVSGGGSLLQDFTSTRSLLYYLYIIRVAKIMGKKVMIYANGIGPVRKTLNRRRVRDVVKRVDVITLRDHESAEELHQMGVSRDDVRVTADPVFAMRSLVAMRGIGATRGNDATCVIGATRGTDAIGNTVATRSDAGEDASPYPDEQGVPHGPFITVSIRDWPGIGDFCDDFAYICDSIYEMTGRRTVFIPMQPDKDTAISRKVIDMMKSPPLLLEGRLTSEELMGIIGASDAMIAMRLHALIFAACMNVPFAGLVYDPKVLAYTNALEMPSAGDVTHFNKDTALEVILELLGNRGDYAGSLKLKTAEFEDAAKEDAALLLSLLRGNG